MNARTNDRHSVEIVELSTGGFEIWWKRGAAQYTYGVFESRAHAQRVLKQMDSRGSRKPKERSHG